jgi:Zn-dependent membrane protease YugP
VDIGWVVLLPVLALVVGSHLYMVWTYRRFRKRPSAAGLTGEQVARALLDRYGLSDVAVKEVRGFLSDGYDLRRRAVRLSGGNYASSSVAALSIAAHEVGHVLQAHGVEGSRDRPSGLWTPRAAMVLIRLAGWGTVSACCLLLVGWLSAWDAMMWGGGIALLWAMGCSLLIVPVEMNVSRRALWLLETEGYLTEEELRAARTVLRAAAWAYASTTGMAFVQILRGMLERDTA